MRPYYATLVCGKADVNGAVEICNAGHCSPLLLQDGSISTIPATGLPVGMFCQERYSSAHIKLGKGDRLLLYTDGLSEARDPQNREYGDHRLPTLLGECHQLSAIALVSRLLQDVSECSSAPRSDDLTVMAIEMVGH
jgi:sigma-B regulation protein RsbU (phosphoserine phosphatase)